MGYFIRAYDPVAAPSERYDLPNQAQRTLAVRRMKADAVQTARALLNVRAEVTILFENDQGVRQIVEDWVPAKTVVLSTPVWIGTDWAVMSWFSRSIVDRHHYEYTVGDGRKRQFAFETDCGEAPQVPQFGTQVAIDRLRLQRHRQDCRAVANAALAASADSGVNDFKRD